MEAAEPRVPQAASEDDEDNDDDDKEGKSRDTNIKKAFAWAVANGSVVQADSKTFAEAKFVDLEAAENEKAAIRAEMVARDTCRNCGGRGHTAKHCSVVRALTCHNCDEDGHKASDCTKPGRVMTKCRKCGEVGHNRADCPLQNCPKCGENGHVANNRTSAIDIRPCARCGEQGHLSKDCKPQKMRSLYPSMPYEPSTKAEREASDAINENVRKGRPATDNAANDN